MSSKVYKDRFRWNLKVNMQIIFQGSSRGCSRRLDTGSNIPVLSNMRDAVKYIVIPLLCNRLANSYTVAHSSLMYLPRA